MVSLWFQSGANWISSAQVAVRLAAENRASPGEAPGAAGGPGARRAAPPRGEGGGGGRSSDLVLLVFFLGLQKLVSPNKCVSKTYAA